MIDVSNRSCAIVAPFEQKWKHHKSQDMELISGQYKQRPRSLMHVLLAGTLEKCALEEC